MVVELREITRETVRAVCALEVRYDQEKYVAANALSIAQAHFETLSRVPYSALSTSATSP